MSTKAPVPASEDAILTTRQREILQEAIEIIATEGYAKLTLRALARASGMKLGALQYHFRTWEDMLLALAAHIATEYGSALDALKTDGDRPSLEDLVRFLMEDAPGASLQADRLLPQLWAMARVEPVMATLLDDIYARCLDELEAALVECRSAAPRADALVLMSLIEGTTLFTGRGCRWEDEGGAVYDAVLSLVGRYGQNDAR